MRPGHKRLARNPRRSRARATTASTITSTTGQAWTGGGAGTVPGGGRSFHVGATFSGIDFDPARPDRRHRRPSCSTTAATRSRWRRACPATTPSTLDASDGTFDLQFSNLAAGQIDISDVLVREFPRPLSIDALVPRSKLFDVFGQPTLPWERSTHLLLGERPAAIKRGGSRKLTLAKLGQGRHILERVGSDCHRGDATFDPDTAACRAGFNVDLFPATTVVVKATVTARNVKHFDRKRKRYVTGNLDSTVYLQIGGRHPDLNRNRRDDAIDIAFGRAKDANRDGVPDTAQRRTVKRPG